MKYRKLFTLGFVTLGGMLLSGAAAAERYYEVTVTNITKGMTFTPIMVATTRRGATFFDLGHAASDEVEIMAETGDIGPLAESLDALDVSDSSFLPFLAPGQSVTQVVATNGRYPSVSIAAMLIPSNDTFVAVNGVRGPVGNRTLKFTVQAYDSGTEVNDELCVSLPGPGCDGDPGPVAPPGEGYVYTATGIRGVGDLDADALDFNNPVAEVTIRRIGRWW